MITKKDFLKKYNILEASFKKAKLTWSKLEAIYADYLKRRPSLEPYLGYFTEALRHAPNVHSIKARLKDPEHLIEKIIRLKEENPSRKITLQNYRDEITDLIGIRALHLFKNDWPLIHTYIVKTWELKSQPIANIREGDPQELLQMFEEKGCEVKKHPFGYRSVHYLIVSKPSREEITAEIQVRTIFEEGWSEIDHLIRYPYVKDEPILTQFLDMFNKLAGNADEMGSFIRFLKVALKLKETDAQQAIEEQSKKIGELKKRIDELNIQSKDRTSLKLDLDEISGFKVPSVDLSGLTVGVSDLIGGPGVDLSQLTTVPGVDLSQLTTVPGVDLSQLTIVPGVDLSGLLTTKVDLSGLKVPTQESLDLLTTPLPVIECDSNKKNRKRKKKKGKTKDK